HVSGAAIAAFALGDSAASLFGRRFGNRILPFNKGKTLEGSIVGFFFAFLFAMYFVPVQFALLAAVVTAMIECLPLPLNDNLAIPVVTGLVLFLTGV
ncbi:phosphatidate cytidylyltransferase, partial [Candidatus Bathyarchaeota archaeon]|nr:phosphatidate cytidylyltransferase [Candidatus Bathyarchaeota archaeon]